MRHPTHGFILFLFTLLSLILWTPAWSADTSAKTAGMGSGPVTIHSNKLVADDRAKTITFWGDVKAEREDFTIDCQKLVVYLKKENPAAKKEEKGSPHIDRIVATGNVKIIRSTGGTATAQQAVYYQNEEKVVLTGEPVVKQGNDFVAGDRITLFLNEDRSIVDSPQDGKVKAVIFPKKSAGE
jgi:lipopolysaccharide export system protein LptA